MEEADERVASNREDESAGLDYIQVRSYQDEIVDLAVEENIVYAHGSILEKTQVTVNLVKRLQYQIDSPWEEGGKRTIMVVPSETSADGQKACFERWTSASVEKYGTDTSLRWIKAEWEAQFRQHQFFIMVPEVLLDLLDNGILGIKKINLLILDECHLATESHSYREIVRHIEKYADTERPRILGLTDTVIDKKQHPSKTEESRVAKLIADLQTSFNAKVRTFIDQSVGIYGEKPLVSVDSYKIHVLTEADLVVTEGLAEFVRWLDAARNRINQLENSATKDGTNISFRKKEDDHYRLSLQRSLLLISRSFYRLKESLISLGPWCAYQLARMIKKDLELLVQNSCFEEELAQPVQCAICELHMFGTFIELQYAPNKVSREDTAGMKRVVSPKLQKLMDILRQYKGITKADPNAPTGLRCVVFVNSRFEAWALNKWLEFITERCDGDFSHIRAEYVDTKAVQTENEKGNTAQLATDHLHTLATLRKFREGLLNLLIATDSHEEMLDIPDCNLVIRFDRPKHYSAYVKSRSFAKAEDSKYIIISDEGEVESLKGELSGYDDLDEVIRKACLGRTPRTTEEEMERSHAELPTDLTSPKDHITLNNALSVLKKYCVSLNSGVHSIIRGTYIPAANNRFKFRLFMSLCSAITHPVTGPAMQSRSLAKQAAASECCRLLCKIGVMDGKSGLVQPPKQGETMRMVNSPIIAVGADGVPLLRSKNRREYYPKQYAALLSGYRLVPCGPVLEPSRQISDSEFSSAAQYSSDAPVIHLYEISIKHRHTFHANPGARFMSDESSSIGVVSPVAIPDIPPFSVYTGGSEYSVTLRNIDQCFSLDSKQLKSVREFHCAVYEQVLRFSECVALHFQPDLDRENLYVVPLKKSVEDVSGIASRQSVCIDWETVHKTKDPVQYCVISVPDEVRSWKKVKMENFRDGVVVRWYKQGEERFFVVDIREDLSPVTPLDLAEFGSFKEYFEVKYGIEIQQVDQPILETKRASPELDLIRPRYFSGAKEKVLKSSRSENQRDGNLKLVPELCQLFPIRASLYAKCLILPSLMHRLRWLCHAVALRERISTETGMGSKCDKPEEWAALQYFGRKTDEMAAGDASMGSVNDSDSLGRDRTARPPEKEVDLPDDFGLLYATYEKERFLAEKDLCSGQPMFPNGDILRRSGADGWHPYPLPDYECSPFLLDPPFSIDAQFSLDARTVPVPDPSQLLVALTSARCGDGFDLERLKFVGNSFLRLSSSICLYFDFPHQQSKLTELSDRHTSDSDLFHLIQEKCLHHFVCNQALDPLENTVPPGYIFNEEESNQILANSGTKADKIPSPRIHQCVEDATIADVAKSLIGCFLIYSSARSAQLFMSWIGLNVLPEIKEPESSRTVDKFGQFRRKDIPGPLISHGEVVEDLCERMTAGFGDFERRIGYRFGNIAFLLQALTHVTYISGSVTDCYQRLEFLGNAVLELLIIRYIFESAEFLEPGVMMDMRSAILNTSTFATLAVKCDYHKHIKLQSYDLFDAIDTFVQQVQEKDEEILPINEEMLFIDVDEPEEGRWETVHEESEAVSVLGDVFKSVAGAVFLDSGLSLDAVWRVYFNIMRSQLEYCLRCCPRNPVRQLMELEKDNCRFGNVELLPSGKSCVQVTILGKGTYTGKGSNARAAKCRAAKNALVQLRKNV